MSHSPPGTVAPRVADDPVTGRDQMHVDIDVAAAEQDAEIERIVVLSATRVSDRADPFVALSDPEGHQLCVCPM